MLPPTGCTAFDNDFANIFAIATREIHDSTALEQMLVDLYRAIFGVDLAPIRCPGASRRCRPGSKINLRTAHVTARPP